MKKIFNFFKYLLIGAVFHLPIYILCYSAGLLYQPFPYGFKYLQEINIWLAVSALSILAFIAFPIFLYFIGKYISNGSYRHKLLIRIIVASILVASYMIFWSAFVGQS